MACSEAEETSGCWHPQCKQALATARHILCGHCAAHGQQRQALLLNLRKAVADVKTALRWTPPPKKDKPYQTMAHTNTCPAYAEAVLALHGARLATIGTDINR